MGSLEAWYAAQYSLMNSANASGEYIVLMCATVIGAAYIVTRGRDYTGREANANGFSDLYSADPGFSKALKPQYDSHFVPVKYINPRLDFQACPEAEAEAHELVSASYDQVLPVAVLYF